MSPGLQRNAAGVDAGVGHRHQVDARRLAVARQVDGGPVAGRRHAAGAIERLRRASSECRVNTMQAGRADFAFHVGALAAESLDAHAELRVLEDARQALARPRPPAPGWSCPTTFSVPDVGKAQLARCSTRCSRARAKRWPDRPPWLPGTRTEHHLRVVEHHDAHARRRCRSGRDRRRRAAPSLRDRAWSRAVAARCARIKSGVISVRAPAGGGSMSDVEKPAGETDFAASLLAELKPGASGAQP